MDKWEPDLKDINRIQSILKKSSALNKLCWMPEVEKTVGDIVELFKSEGLPDVAEYLSRNFSLEQKLCDHHLTGQEAIDAMRQGTPYGILLYYTLYPHAGCF